MAKGGRRGRRGISSRECRWKPYPNPLRLRSGYKMRCPKSGKDWVDATCSVCMEFPHNAVLLLCSSHDKGCRPYMCGTSWRYSNCLDQYHKALAKVSLDCPLCRGQVKGWTIVEAAREHLNAKRRGCMQDGCPFVGTYKELRKHVRAEHPCARPHQVDPAQKQRWSRLEREREREDVLSTIRSSTPGAVFFGDYVIEAGNDEDDGRGDVDRNLLPVFMFLRAVGWARRAGEGRHGIEYFDDGEDNGISLAGRLRRQGRVVLGRRRRHRR